SLAGALALITSDDALRRARALTSVQTAQPHDAQPRSLRHTGPGIGTLLRLVLLDEMHESARVPRVPDCASSCRLVTCARDAAGTRSGTSGNPMGQAPLQGACAAA